MSHSRPNDPCVIYAIEAENGLVKIGATKDLATRVCAIFSASPIATRLIIAIPGLRAHEAELHQLLRPYRVRTEWFRNEGVVRYFVETYRGVGVERIADWADLSPEARRAKSAAKRSASMKACWADPERRAEWMSTLTRYSAKRAAGRLDA